MKVIKDAFVEGRDTDVSWEQSQARRNQVKLETFTSNVNNFNGRRFNSLMPIARINPETGKEEARFDSRLAAARWIVENVLHWEGDIEPKAMSITGNMHMCISNGWKSYGFFWRYLTAEQSRTVGCVISPNSEPVWVYGQFGTSHFQEKVFPSIRAASRATGVNDRRVKRSMVDGSPEVAGFVFRVYNTKPTIRTFRTLVEFADTFGLSNRSHKHFNRFLKLGATINNTTIVIAKRTTIHRTVSVFVGRRKVESFSTLKAAATFLGVDAKRLRKYANTNQKLDGRYIVKLDEQRIVEQ